MADFDVNEKNKELHNEIKACIQKYCPYLFEKVLNNFTDEIHIICGNYTNDILSNILGGVNNESD